MGFFKNRAVLLIYLQIMFYKMHITLLIVVLQKEFVICKLHILLFIYYLTIHTVHQNSNNFFSISLNLVLILTNTNNDFLFFLYLKKKVVSIIIYIY